mmetsp:Transcript_114894/g.319538  ORF Transcript_114894/g.319538 Transcript_114894/m.319538 type:complete len:205 (+) Transcript_114894:98-712(+)
MGVTSSRACTTSRCGIDVWRTQATALRWKPRASAISSARMVSSRSRASTSTVLRSILWRRRRRAPLPRPQSQTARTSRRIGRTRPAPLARSMRRSRGARPRAAWGRVGRRVGAPLRIGPKTGAPPQTHAAVVEAAAMVRQPTAANAWTAQRAGRTHLVTLAPTTSRSSGARRMGRRVRAGATATSRTTSTAASPRSRPVVNAAA